MTRTLMDIEADMQALDDLLFEIGGDVSDPRVEQAVSEWMAELDKDVKGKIDGYCSYIRELEGRAAFHAEEAARMMHKAQTEDKQVDFLKSRLKAFLELRQVSKVETPRFRVGIVRNGGALPLLIDASADIPQEFTREIPARREPDKDKLRTALEAGTAITGVALGQRGTRLSIK